MSGVALLLRLNLISWVKVVNNRPQFCQDMFFLWQWAIILWDKTQNPYKASLAPFYEIDY